MRFLLQTVRRHKVATLAILLVLTALGLLFCWQILISPGNPLTRLFRNSISDTDAKVVTGPYPLEEDFELLHDAGVTTIVSLLDADMPYEKVLLERERELAARYGMTVHNFPIKSVAGVAFGEKKDINAEAAAQEILALPGKIYLHCYLGLHRAVTVVGILEEKGALTGKYAIRQGERSPDMLLLDKADGQYKAGQFEEAISTVQQMSEQTFASILLQAWSHYRLQQIADARPLFEQAILLNPDSADAHTGLGYCALRTSDLTAAEKAFESSAALAPTGSARTGLAMVRIRQGRRDEARQLLEAVLQENPNHSDARAALDSITDKN